MNERIVVSSLLACLGCAAMRGEGETKLGLEEAPPAVRATIVRELGDGKLEDIARVRRDGRTVFEADFVRQGAEWELVVDGDGAVVSREQEGDHDARAQQDGWRSEFDVPRGRLAARGDNRWLAIRPGRVLHLRHGADTLMVSVLDETTVVDGVEVGVLEERETRGGALIEVSRNFFATDPGTGDVYYFGEDVDNYQGGKLVNHDSAWRSGVAGAKFGLMVPGEARVGQRYYQEIAPGVALDRVEIVSISETLRTPAGTFENCLHLRETTPLEKGESHKWYAPGVGLVKDDEFELAQEP